MVAFNSDWCPACLKMENRWNYFGDWCKDHDIAVGKVDIGASPILTGMALPVMQFQDQGYKII